MNENVINYLPGGMKRILLLHYGTSCQERSLGHGPGTDLPGSDGCGGEEARDENTE